MRLRSIVRIPASGEGLDAALESGTDAIAFTVADESVAVGTLRNRALEGADRAAAAGKGVLVVVNHPRTRLLRDDLDALVTPNLGAVLLPQTTDPQDVRDLAVLLREFEFSRGLEPGVVAALPVIDTARGLLRATEIAAAVPRCGGLVFAAEDFAFDIGARHEEQGSRLAFARGMVVAAARASDGLPLVTSNPFELRDLFQQGFAGALLPDAAGVVSANAVFTPTEFRVAKAREAISAYDAARAEGAWVARLDAGVIDAHAARKAQQIIEQAGD